MSLKSTGFLAPHYNALHNRWEIRQYGFLGIFWKTVATFETMVGAVSFVRENGKQKNETGGQK